MVPQQCRCLKQPNTCLRKQFSGTPQCRCLKPGCRSPFSGTQCRCLKQKNLFGPQQCRCLTWQFHLVGPSRTWAIPARWTSFRWDPSNVALEPRSRGGRLVAQCRACSSRSQRTGFSGTPAMSLLETLLEPFCQLRKKV